MLIALRTRFGAGCGLGSGGRGRSGRRGDRSPSGCRRGWSGRRCRSGSGRRPGGCLGAQARARQPAGERAPGRNDRRRSGRRHDRCRRRRLKPTAPLEAEVGRQRDQHHHDADQDLAADMTAAQPGRRQIVAGHAGERSAHPRPACLATREDIVVVEIRRDVRPRLLRRGPWRLRPGGTRPARGHGAAVRLRHHVEKRAQLVEVAEAPPGPSRRADAIAAGHAPLDHPFLQGLRIAEPVGLAFVGGEHPRGSGVAAGPWGQRRRGPGGTRRRHDEGVSARRALHGGAILRHARVIELVFGLATIAAYVHFAGAQLAGRFPATIDGKHTTPGVDVGPAGGSHPR